MWMPALLTSTSSRPKRASVRSTSADHVAFDGDVGRDMERRRRPLSAMRRSERVRRRGLPAGDDDARRPRAANARAGGCADAERAAGDDDHLAHRSAASRARSRAGVSCLPDREAVPAGGRLASSAFLLAVRPDVVPVDRGQRRLRIELPGIVLVGDARADVEGRGRRRRRRRAARRRPCRTSPNRRSRASSRRSSCLRRCGRPIPASRRW